MFESGERASRAMWLVWFAVIGATTFAWSANAFDATGTPSPVPLRMLWACPATAVLLAAWWRGLRGALVATLAVAVGALAHVVTTSTAAFTRGEWLCLVGLPLCCDAIAGGVLRWQRVDLRRPGAVDAARFVACTLVASVLAAGTTVALLAQFGHAPADVVRALLAIAIPDVGATVVSAPVAFVLRAARARHVDTVRHARRARSSLTAAAPRAAAILAIVLLVAMASLGGPRLDVVAGSLLFLGLAALAEERRRSEDAARRALADHALERARVRAVLDHAPDGVLVLDALGRVECANRGAGRIFGVAPDALVGRSLRELVPVPDGVDPARHIVELLGAGRDPVALTTWQAQGVDGRVFPAELSVSRVEIDDRWGYIVTVRDDADLLRLDQQLAHRGALSVAPSVADRSAFRSHVALALHEMRRRPSGIGVILVGIDRRPADRLHGIDTGERLVREAARRLGAQARRTDVVARVGPDRLALLLWPCADVATAESVAMRAQAELARPSCDVPDATSPTCRVGIVTSWDPDASPDRVIRDAELALARARRDPTGVPCRYETSVDIRTASGAVRIDLRDQITHDRVAIRYQPILDLASGRVTSIEALARLRRDDGSLVQPSEFLAASERAGLIAQLGAIVLPRAVHDLASLREQEGAEDLQVAVNVSPHQLDDELCELVDDTLAETQLPPPALVLEITESAPVDTVAGAADVLRRLQARGVGIALDDFGAGFTRPDLIRDLPLDAIKIDRSFVQTIVESDIDRDIVGAIVTLARRRHLTIIAEGVETVEQAHLLARLGCTHAQGFLFGRPVDIDELAYLLREWHIVPAIATNLVRTR